MCISLCQSRMFSARPAVIAPRSQAMAHGAVTARLETNRAPPGSGFAGPEQRVPAVTLGHEVFALDPEASGGDPVPVSGGIGCRRDHRLRHLLEVARPPRLEIA